MMASVNFFVFLVIAVSSVLSISNARESFPSFYQKKSFKSKRLERFPPHYRKDSTNDVKKLPRINNTLNYRLPNNTEPLHYDIELSTKVHSGEREFSGKVNIQLQILQDTRTIVLHKRQLIVSSANIQRDTGGSSYALDQSYEEEREFLSLTPQDPKISFRAGEKWILTIQYSGLLREGNAGFFITTYTDESNKPRYFATTQFESTDARHAFPCYDEPAKRATFTIAINHHPYYHAISNMPVDSSKSTTGRTVFQTTPSMPTYLVAFVVSDLKYSEGKLNSLPQRVHSRPGTENEREWALVSGMLILQRLTDYYGIEFALPKIDQVAVRNNGGAMENWGLVTQTEDDFLYDKDKSTVQMQTSIVIVTAHEYAHQWFGNLVTMKWWTYLWLKEGFASLFSYYATDKVYPEWDIYQIFHIDEYQRALTSDVGLKSRAMTHYVQATDINQIYDYVTYTKAECVLFMWQHALTDTAFRQGLHTYLERNKYSAADETDLFHAIQDATSEIKFPIPATIEDMISSWTRQGGYPLLTVERNYDDGSFTIRQERFYNNASLTSDETWYIPINAAIQSNPDFGNTTATHYMLKSKELKVTDVNPPKDDWLILNKQSTGYYRINYDERNWQLIINGLIQRPHRVHPRNRAQLMHDAYTLSSYNRLKKSILLGLLTYLPKEDQYAPWSNANEILTYLNFYLSGDAEYQIFKDYVAMLVSNIYEKLGVHHIHGEQHLQKYIRPKAINLACMVEVNSCLVDTNTKLVRWIENGVEIEKDMIPEILCNGLKQSSDKEFNFIYNELMKSNDQDNRRLLISSLGCAQKEEHLKKILESSIDMNNSLQSNERNIILHSVYSRGTVGVNACIEFLKQNWSKYAGLGLNLDNDIFLMAGYVNNKHQEKELLELVEMVKDSEHVGDDLEESVQDSINDTFNWLEENRDEIMEWLANYFKKP